MGVMLDAAVFVSALVSVLAVSTIEGPKDAMVARYAVGATLVLALANGLLR